MGKPLNFNTLRRHLNNMQRQVEIAHKGKFGPVPNADYTALWKALEELEELDAQADKIALERCYGWGE